MQEMDDIELLREYAERDSEAAFAGIVARHLNQVYSVALRHAGNPHAAEEITQAVFVILATKARRLNRRVILSGWLYETARLTALTFVRSEIRRARREEAHMQSILNESESDSSRQSGAEAEVWTQIAPLLDAALAKLNETDRHAVVLRFFDGKSMKEVGAALGANEDAAKKRVSRALEKLRKIFTKHGVVSTTNIIAGAISANSVQAAPAALAKTVTTVALAKGAAASASTLTLIQGALKIMAWTKMKTVAVISVAAILAAGTTTIIIKHQNQGERLPKPQPVATGQTEFPKTSWHFAGYANPESALMSCMWAVNNDDSKALLASVSPSEQERLRRGKEIITDSDRADYAKMTGYQIVDKQVLSENRVILAIKTAGQEQTAKFFVERIDGEWKFAGNAAK
jgi:RNA polymerase sigma factor (sigma-70 family)